MRHSALVLFGVVAGVCAAGSVLAAQANMVQVWGADTGNAANPNATSCEDLGARAENLVAALDDTYNRYKTGEDVTADLGQILSDLTAISGDIGPCTGQGGSVPGGTGGTGGLPGGADQQQQDQQAQQGAQEQQAAQDVSQAQQGAQDQAQAQGHHHHHHHHY